MMRHHLAVLIVTLACGCQRQEHSPDDVPTSQSPTPFAPAASAPPTPPDMPDDASLITHEGTLEMARVPGGKAFQPTTLLLDDGRVLLLSYRPMPDYFHLVGQRVIATGAHQHLSNNVQQVGGDHFSPDTITPAYDKLYVMRQDLPPTPLLATHDQAPHLHNRWVHVHGSFEQAVDDEDRSSWVHVTFRMKADDPIRINLARSTFEQAWEPLRGRPMTVIGKLHAPQDNETGAQIVMYAPLQICAGHKPGCTKAKPTMKTLIK